jgi:hypothetical protein
MPATRFKGPVRTGHDTGAPSTSTLSTVPAVRRISVSGDGVYAAGGIPACDIARMWINTETAWEGSAGCTTTLRVGTSADNDLYGSVVLSAVGTRDLNLSAAAIGLVSGISVIVDVTTVGTAGVGVGSFFVEYLQAE